MEALAFERGPYVGKRSKVRALVHAVRNIIPAVPEPAPPSLDPLQALRMEALRALAEYVHTRLAMAPDLDELGSAIDDLLRDEVYTRIRDRLVEFLSVDGGLDILIDPTSAPRPDYLLRLVSDDPALVSLVEKGHDLQMAYLKAGLQWITHWQKNLRSENHDAPKPTLWFLDDPRIPLELKKVWLAREKSDVCQDGLFSAAFRGGFPRWIVKFLLHGWVDGIHAYLTFLCGQPGVDPPDEKLVRRDEILDTPRLFVLHGVSELGYQERLKAARRSGDWYPMPEPEDGG